MSRENVRSHLWTPATELFFGEQMPVSAAIEHVERYRETQRRHLERFRASAARLEADLAGTPRLPYWRAVLSGGEDYAEMALRWCDRTLEELRRLDPAEYPVTPAPNPAPTNSEAGG